MKTERIGGTVFSLLDSLGLNDAKKCAMIISAWENIAGERLTNLVRPESFRYGTLHLSVSNHSWAQELQLLKPQFLEKVNGVLGKDAVKDIRFRVRGER